jgi:putative endopeptidase
MYGTYGFDTAGMDRTAPVGDFWQYANGTWLKTTKIPADKAAYALFTVLVDLSDARTKEIILGANGAPGSDERKIADVYASFMDEAAIEQKGVAAIQPELDRIAAIKDKAGVVSELAYDARNGITSPFAPLVTIDDKDPAHYMLAVFQSGLGLWDRDMYDRKNKQFDAARSAYRAYIATMLGLGGITKDVAARAAAIYALEEQIAAVHWTQIQNRDAVKTYNMMPVAQLVKLAPGMPWTQWLQQLGAPNVTKVDVAEPSAIAGIAKLVASQPLAVWKDYLTVRQLDDAAPAMSKAFVDANFTVYAALTGTPQNKERWKRGVDRVNGALGHAVGKLYVAKWFPPATKARADELVKNLLTAMGQRLDALTWMSPETKAKAKAKLATYNPKIGYPKHWRDYSKLEVVAGDPVGNTRRGSELEWNRRLARLDGPVDRDDWEMTPNTVNAYYNATLNEIVFPAAILQPPFFDPNADDAVNYGGIGAVIGHEISHGFDDQGAKYDGTGTLKDWWTADDAKKFKAATGTLVAQYSGYCPIPASAGKQALCVKGELTLGENIADLAGITISHLAYQLSLGGKPAPVIDGTTGEQRFFLAFAQIWRELDRDEALAAELVTDPHSPGELRAATLRNVDAWYDAFQPAPDSKLYLAPDKRVHIW